MFVTSVSTNRGKEGWVIQTSYGTTNEQPYSIYQIDCFFSLLPMRMLTSEFNNSVISVADPDLELRGGGGGGP